MIKRETVSPSAEQFGVVLWLIKRASLPAYVASTAIDGLSSNIYWRPLCIAEGLKERYFKILIIQKLYGLPSWQFRWSKYPFTDIFLKEDLNDRTEYLENVIPIIRSPFSQGSQRKRPRPYVLGCVLVYWIKMSLVKCKIKKLKLTLKFPLWRETFLHKFELESRTTKKIRY